MKFGKHLGILLVLVLLAAIVMPVSTASAHTSFPTGPYVVEIGWLNEPPVVGQPNAIVVNLSVNNQSSSSAGSSQSTPPATSSASAAPVKMDYSGLTLQVSYGGQTKMLTLQPQSENTPFDLMGVMTPSVMGRYTVLVNGTLTGDLGSTAVAISMQPEEVVGIDTVQFPNLSGAQTGQTSSNGTSNWLPIAALAAGIIGIILGVIALVFRRA